MFRSPGVIKSGLRRESFSRKKERETGPRHCVVGSRPTSPLPGPCRCLRPRPPRGLPIAVLLPLFLKWTHLMGKPAINTRRTATLGGSGSGCSSKEGNAGRGDGGRPEVREPAGGEVGLTGAGGSGETPQGRSTHGLWTLMNLRGSPPRPRSVCQGHPAPCGLAACERCPLPARVSREPPGTWPHRSDRQSDHGERRRPGVSPEVRNLRVQTAPECPGHTCPRGTSAQWVGAQPGAGGAGSPATTRRVDRLRPRVAQSRKPVAEGR